MDITKILFIDKIFQSLIKFSWLSMKYLWSLHRHSNQVSWFFLSTIQPCIDTACIFRIAISGVRREFVHGSWSSLSLRITISFDLHETWNLSHSFCFSYPLNARVHLIIDYIWRTLNIQERVFFIYIIIIITKR